MKLIKVVVNVTKPLIESFTTFNVGRRNKIINEDILTVATSLC